MSTRTTAAETDCIDADPLDDTLSTGWIEVYRALHVSLPYAEGESQ